MEDRNALLVMNHGVALLCRVFFCQMYDSILVMICARHVLFIFLLKISPQDQTLSPTCKFLIVGIFYHTIFFLLEKYSI